MDRVKPAKRKEPGQVRLPDWILPHSQQERAHWGLPNGRRTRDLLHRLLLAVHACDAHGGGDEPALDGLALRVDNRRKGLRRKVSLVQMALRRDFDLSPHWWSPFHPSWRSSDHSSLFGTLPSFRGRLRLSSLWHARLLLARAQERNLLCVRRKPHPCLFPPAGRGPGVRTNLR